LLSLFPTTILALMAIVGIILALVKNA
jgi:hypothetical protein